jgi:hypothetical protein
LLAPRHNFAPLPGFVKVLAWLHLHGISIRKTINRKGKTNLGLTIHYSLKARGSDTKALCA